MKAAIIALLLLTSCSATVRAVGYSIKERKDPAAQSCIEACGKDHNCKISCVE
jgi:hypothetical protein